MICVQIIPYMCTKNSAVFDVKKAYMCTKNSTVFDVKKLICVQKIPPVREDITALYTP